MPVNSHKFHQPFRYLRSIFRDLCGAERDFRPVTAKHGHCNPCIDDICNIQARSPNEMAASESAILFASQIRDPRCLTKSATLVPLQNPQPPSRHKIYPVAPQEEEEEEEEQQQEICFLQKHFSTLIRSCLRTSAHEEILQWCQCL